MSRKSESKLNINKKIKRGIKRENSFSLPAFTMAEMMIVLLILGMVVAAFTPMLMKQRIKNAEAATGDIWQLTKGIGPDIFYGTEKDKRVAIGTNAFAAGDNGRLLINTKDASQNHILFKVNNSAVGRLILDGNGNIGLGDVDTGNTSGKSKTIAIGSTDDVMKNRTQALGNYSLALGFGAIAGDTTTASTDANSIAIGTNIKAMNENSIAIGTNSAATTSATAIGDWVSANGDHSTGIGGKITTEANSVAISNVGFSWAKASSVVIGGSSAGPGSVVLGGIGGSGGNDSVCAGFECQITQGKVAFGSQANADWTNSIAIGSNSMANAGGSTAIGHQSQITGSEGTSIGNSSGTLSSDGSTLIGNNTMTSTANTTTLGASTNTIIIPGTLQIRDPYLTAGGRNGAKLAINAGLVGYASDKRLKNINGISNIGLNQIRKLKIYDYVFKSDKEKTPRVGVIAQDLQKVFPNAVKKGDDGYLMIRQDDMFYALLNSIKQLDSTLQGIVKDFKTCVENVQHIDDEIIALVKVEQLKAKKIRDLKDKNKKLETQITDLEKLIKNKVW